VELRLRLKSGRAQIPLSFHTGIIVIIIIKTLCWKFDIF